jgi:putative glutathione S-transferase
MSRCPVELTHTSSTRSHRTLIVRKLKGLEEYLDVVVVHSFMGALGWSFYPPVRDEEGGFPQTKVRLGASSLLGEGQASLDMALN